MAARSAWGFGIEHEMMFADITEKADKGTVCLDSEDIVFNTNGGYLRERASDAASTAPLGAAPYLAWGFQPTEINMTLDKAAIEAPTKAAAPRNPATSAARWLTADRARLILESAILTAFRLRTWFGAFKVASFDAQRRETRAAEAAEAAKVVDEIHKATIALYRELGVLKPDEEPEEQQVMWGMVWLDHFTSVGSSPDNTLAVARAFLTHDKRVQTYLEAILRVFEKLRKTNDNWPRYGDRVFTDLKKKTLSIERGNNSKRSATKISASHMHTLITGVPLLRGIRHDAVFHLDGRCVETKTTRFANVKVEALIRELWTNESWALVGARKITQGAHILPYSGYTDLVQDGVESPKVGYAGSYHFWFTLPHVPWRHGDADAVPKQMAFASEHAAFALSLQWMEPLLLASFTSCHPSAIGAGTKFPRAHMRGIINEYSGIGTVDVCGHMPLTSEHNGPLSYYKSRAALETAMQSPSWTSTYMAGASSDPLGRPPFKLYYSLDGKSFVPYLTSFNVGRIPPLPSARIMDGGPFEASTTLWSRQSAPLPHNEILRREYNAPFSTLYGSNVRYDWTTNFELPLKKGWTAVPVQVGDKLVFHFVNEETRACVLKVPLKSKVIGKRVTASGLEFRVMDNFPSTELPAFMYLCVLVAAATNATRASATCQGVVQKDADWTKAAAAMLVGGSYAAAPPGYIAKLRDRLGLSSASANAKKGSTFWDALTDVYEDLHARYASHPWVSLMYARPPKQAPHLININQDAWEYFFERHHAPKLGKEKLRKIKSYYTFRTRKAAAKPVDEKSVLKLLGKDWAMDMPYLWEMYYFVDDDE